MGDLDVAVVGGGLAGLTAAAYAARAGASVGVFEKAASPGGRARTRDADAYLFNLGPHALYRSGEAFAILRELGVPARGRMPAASGGFAIRGGRRHTLPVGAYSLLTTGLLPLAGKLEAGRLLAGLRRLRTSPHDRVSVGDWLRSEVRHEGVRELMAAFVGLSTYAHDPERQSAGAALRQLQRASNEGVLYLDGGWQSLVDGLRHAATTAGAVVTCRSGAIALARGAGASFCLRLADGGLVKSRGLIVATSPREAAALLGPLAPATTDWGADAVPVHVACLDLGLRRLTRPASRFALGIDEPLYASVHSVAARLAPPGGAVLHLARYLGAEPASDVAVVEEQLEDLAELLQPGWRSEVVTRRFLPDLVVSNALVRADLGEPLDGPDRRCPVFPEPSSRGIGWAPSACLRMRRWPVPGRPHARLRLTWPHRGGPPEPPWWHDRPMTGDRFTIPDLTPPLEAHRSFLWSLLYRLTGSAADADDLVQETFLRAIERPPARTDAPWRPWLVRVGMNLGRDLLRKRRRRGYVGVWLPSPVDTEDEPPSFEPADAALGPAARYDRLESRSFAFLLALEALRPSQRAVLLLRDVLDLSVKETARALGMTETNVKTTYLRARRAMAAYDRRGLRPTQVRQQETGQALERFLTGLAAGDAAGLVALLAQDVRTVSDGGGEFVTALHPIVGPERVARFYLGLLKKLGTGGGFALRSLNGLPALVVERPEVPSGFAPRFTLQCELGGDGRIARVYVVLATRKLAAVRRANPS